MATFTDDFKRTVRFSTVELADKFFSRRIEYYKLIYRVVDEKEINNEAV